eukprot:SAG22_NODE_13256_length_412_cov_1.207668_1_plen_34_part_01
MHRRGHFFCSYMYSYLNLIYGYFTIRSGRGACAW